MIPINNYIVDFFGENEDMVRKWMSDINQLRFQECISTKGKSRTKLSPRTAYNFFCREQRIKTGKKISVKSLGAMWKRIKRENGEELRYYIRMSYLDNGENMRRENMRLNSNIEEYKLTVIDLEKKIRILRLLIDELDQV